MSALSNLYLGSFGFMYLFWGFFWILPAAYLLLRWRAYREQSPLDPQLGFKTALYYFKTLAYHVLLAAAFCMLFGLLTSHVREEMVRLAIGLALGGGLVYGTQCVLIDKYTNTHQHTAPARLFNGFNLVICGLLAMAAVIGFFAIVVQRNAPSAVIKGFIVLAVVYGPAAFAQAFYLHRRGGQQQSL
jgi:hypothetical protein